MLPFTYQRVSSASDAASAGQADGAMFLAGGTNLVDLMKTGVARPRMLIDIGPLPLTGIEPQQGGGVRIGAMAKNSAVANHPLIREQYPVLAQALLLGASPQIRNMATVGGNLLQRTRCFYFYDSSYRECNKRTPGSGCAARVGYNRIHAVLGGSPECVAVHPSDMAVAMAALDAVVQVQGPHGERSIDFADFYRLPGDTPHLETGLQPGELITAVDLPPAIARRSRYLKVRDRNSYAFALASAAVVLDVDPNNRIRNARIALGGVGTRPWRKVDAEQTLVGLQANDESYRRAADILVRGAQPLRYNGFKVELAKRVTVRALSAAAASA